MNQKVLLNQVLRNNGYSATATRHKVFEKLKHHGPCSLHQLQNHTKNTVHRASVYRTALLFESLGIVQRIPHGWKYKLELSDMFTDHHHHAHCTRCNIMIKLHHDDLIERAISQLANNNNLSLTSHTLEMHGICHDCQTLKS